MIRDTPPSKILRGYMRDCNLSIRKIAKRTGLPKDLVVLLVAGDTDFNATVSRALQKVFTLDSGYWADLQDTYDKAQGKYVRKGGLR